jgi:hypothetical protein
LSPTFAAFPRRFSCSQAQKKGFSTGFWRFGVIPKRIRA